MEYKFLDCDDDDLIRLSEMPIDDGIAVVVRTTGYNVESDEVVQLTISDLNGNVLFSQRVKPQNADDWSACEASGGISPADVEDLPELFQFEDEVIELVEKAEIVVGQHLPFVEGVIESSWISLPKFEGVDVIELFCQSHCTADYPGNPATAASLAGIAAYYDLENADETAEGEAALVASCYRALVSEFVEQRAAKGEEHWRRYDESKAGERAEQERIQAVVKLREHRYNQMNGLLWIAAAIIFTSLAIQLYQRGGDMGIIVIAGAMAVFALSRGIVNFRK